MKDEKEVKIIERLKENYIPVDIDEAYDAMLTEIYGDVDICGMSYDAGYALKKLDPTAYRCGSNDWVDAQIQNGIYTDEIDGEYYLQDDYDAAEKEIDDEEADKE